MAIRSALFVAAGLTWAAGSALAANGFINLGANVQASDVSADGSIIVGEIGANYFMWTQSTGIVNIGGLTASAGGAGRPSISNDGTRIAGTNLNPASGLSEIGYYTPATGEWTYLGGIGGESDGNRSSGWGISGNGQTVVGLGWIDPGTAHAVRWNEGGVLSDMGSTVPDRSSRANGVNFDGSVVVGWQDAQDGFRQAAVWNNGVQTIITDSASGDPLGEAGAVSANGEWVVGSGAFSNNGEAWRWSAATGSENLGHLSPTFRGAATGISDDGSVIVGYDRPFGPALFGQGFIWTEDLGMVNLNDYAASLGIDTQGVTMSLPLGISADGRTIVGLGLGATPGSVGWSLTIPAPASAFGLGFLGLAGARRRR